MKNKYEAQSGLNPRHWEEIVVRSGVSERIARLNFRTIEDPREADQTLNLNVYQRWKHSHHLTPGWLGSGVDPKTGEPTMWGVQYKPDIPLINADGKPIKYMNPVGEPTQPTFLDTGDRNYWPQILALLSAAIFLIEGLKKAGCLLGLGYAAISIPGVWNGQVKGRLKDSVQQFCGLGRPVYLGFDSDMIAKHQVQQALERLGRLLVAEGCVVKVVVWDPQYKGIDDLYIDAGAQAVHDAIANALTFEEWRDGLETAVNLPKKTAGDMLLELAQQAVFFHSSDQVAYADLSIEGRRHTYPVRSKPFRMWLLEQYFVLKGKGVGSQTLQDTLATLEAIAIFKGEAQEVNLRVAQHGGKLYLDRGSPDWQAIEVDADGWRLVDEPPIRFMRPETLLALPAPEAGSLSELRGLLNVDEQAWILISTFLLFCFHPKYPKPVLILHGEQGSGKTTIAEFLKSLIDPGKAALLPAVTDTHRMAVAASRRWLLAYDNLSGVSAEQSDVLCRISTGGGFSTRTLYTTGDETVFEFIRPQILTGIDAIATRGDLLDRALMVALPSIPSEIRKTREELEIELDRARPRILGALLTVLSQTLKALPDIQPGALPRMADYAKFAIAAEGALGLHPGEFLRAYQGNRAETHEIALEASPVAIAIQRLMEQRTVWQGTATELIADLERLMPEAIVRSRSWASNPRSLGKALARLKPDLRGTGIDVDYFRSGKRGTRKIILEKLAFFLSETSALSAKTLEGLPDKDSEADMWADKRLTREDLADKKRQPNVSQNVSPESLDLQGFERSADKADVSDKKNAQNSKSLFRVGDIVIALKDFPGQKNWIPKGAWGEILMSECNGLIRVRFDEGVRDVPTQDLEAAL